MLAIIISVEVLEANQKTRNIVNVVYAIFLGLLFVGLIVCWFIKPAIIKVSTINLILALILVIAFAMVYYFIENDENFKPPVLAEVFGITIILISTSVMAHNSTVTNSTRDMVRFIDNVSDVENKTILVYDYLITSIPFYTNDTLITLKSTHNTTDREVEFENDELWKERLWDEKRKL